MPKIREVTLPGVGVRYEFDTEAGEQVGVIAHRGGWKELLVYDADDPDRCRTVLHMTEDETRALGELMGGSTVSQVATAIEQDIQGLTIAWLRIAKSSSSVGRTIGDQQVRSRTGVSIVAVVRGDQTIPSPEPDFAFAVGDMAVAVGTPDGVRQVRDLLS
ncbi:cation:proton antiporter regulatory subunit [Euzebya pacifica]|uniref:cation:proton antiporter regulatory subunit n=1 Tax=Euzebya pacifica TaxID=1608957 RepID=UPI0030F982AF